jgi:hypothetical protein
MAHLGKTIQLKGISNKGKNRIKEHSNQWTVLAETETVLFAPSQKGPWLFVTPKGRDQNDKASRWIKLEGDPDFVIEE